MRRWNGWGEKSYHYPVPAGALKWLESLIGPGTPPADAPYEPVLEAVPASTLPDHPLLHLGAEERMLHARGQSFPDWVAMRFGRFERFPEAVAYPESDEEVEALYALARQIGAVLIPYGGGTSVVGGINPEVDGPPTISVDMAHLSELLNLDERSRLATFGAGIPGPNLEAALRAQGYTLGHYPQSFELSTLGGWIATRSSGQQSLYYGRVENFFMGGRMVAPGGRFEMPPYAASAAGPDLRQMVLGSEGRMGIITEATVRITPQPRREQFYGVFFHGWEQAVQAVREMAQARLPLSMLRLSNPEETDANLMLAGHEDLVGMARNGLSLLGYERMKMCMLLIGVTGDDPVAQAARREALAICRRLGGFNSGTYMGKTWAKGRFRTPYLRNSLWEAGYATETLETFTPWVSVESTVQSVLAALRCALDGTQERVHAFAHLSHVYPTGCSMYFTFLFRVLPDPDQTLEHWRRLKHAASLAILQAGGTITHQHAIGRDHAPYLAVEKGPLGMAYLAESLRHWDPEGLLNPGKLIRADAEPLAKEAGR